MGCFIPDMMLTTSITALLECVTLVRKHSCSAGWSIPLGSSSRAVTCSTRTLSFSLSCLPHHQREQGAGRFCPDTPLRLRHERFELQPHGDGRPSLDGLRALVCRPGFALGSPPLAPQDGEPLHVAGRPSLR